MPTIMNDVEKEEISTVTHITSTGTHVLYAVLLQHAGSLAGATVVEIGCGNGRGTMMISQAAGPSGRVLASDVSLPIVESTERALSKGGASNVEVRVADCQDLSYIPDGTVDVFIANLVVHLVDSPSRVIGEAFRVLKPGGALCFSCGGTSDDPQCFVKASAECVMKAGGDWKRAEEWLDSTRGKGSIDGVRALMNLHGFTSVLGWRQDVALCVESPEEAALLVRANAFTKELVPEDKRGRLEDAAKEWGTMLFASRRPPVFGATCFKARKPGGLPRMREPLLDPAVSGSVRHGAGSSRKTAAVRGTCKVCGLSVTNDEVRIRHTEGGYSHEQCHLNRSSIREQRSR